MDERHFKIFGGMCKRIHDTACIIKSSNLKMIVYHKCRHLFKSQCTSITCYQITHAPAVKKTQFLKKTGIKLSILTLYLPTGHEIPAKKFPEILVQLKNSSLKLE